MYSRRKVRKGHTDILSGFPTPSERRAELGRKEGERACMGEGSIVSVSEIKLKGK